MIRDGFGGGDVQLIYTLRGGGRAVQEDEHVNSLWKAEAVE